MTLLAALLALSGAVGQLSQPDGRPVARCFRNVYHLLSARGDSIGGEDEDRAIADFSFGSTNIWRCVNPKLPGIVIEKRLIREGSTLRRQTVFESDRDEPRFLRFETEGHFDHKFMEKVWFLGSGYIGPHKPYPHKPAPQEMNWYVQSTKGLVFTNPENRRGDFAHWRVKIDDTPVLPWWHSTINTYREKADRLWFLPDGYKMCLGTFGVAKGRPVTIEDRFDCFDGGIYAFFEERFATEPAVRDELAAIPPAQPWVDNLLAVVQSGTLDYYRYLSEMEPELPILGIESTFGNWGDYRPVNGVFTGNYGGTITTNEVSEYLDRLLAISPTVKHHFYQLVISVGGQSPVFAEHPEWFRRHSRDGKDDSLFPGDRNNWQTMFVHPAVRRFLIDSSCAFADFCRADAIYNDEAQMTNSIDWDREIVTRDDDVVKYWRELRQRAARDRRALYFNGSGNPYAELNCMESPHELKPERWRDWVGVAWGIGMMNRLKPGNRTVLLYWREGLDYVNRILALGWLPYPAQSVRMYPLDVMRAVHQSGSLLPVNIDYSPDWKRDRHTKVESHSVRRADGPDTLISFINRESVTTNLKVRVDLATLGWRRDGAVNVWMLTPRPDPEKGVRYMLSDAEIRANWRQGVNAGGTFLDQRLVWSGRADGSLELELERVAANGMRQLLFVPGELAFYAVGDRPCDYPYVTDRRGRIRGDVVDTIVAADLTLGGVGAEFSEVTVNGVSAKTRAISVGGRNFTLVSVPAGRSTLTWRKTAERADAPLAPDPLRLTGPASKVRWNSDRHVPARREMSGLNVVGDGFKLSARGTYLSAWRDAMGVQAGLVPMVAIADPTNRTLTVGTSRRECGYDYAVARSWAGFEICWAKALRIDYRHTFGDVNAVASGYTNRHWPRQEENFVGFCVDYRVNGSYVRRVAYRMDGRKGPLDLTGPDWGYKNAKPDLVVDLGNRIDGASTGSIDLDLTANAPVDWDGTVFLSAGATRLWPNRRLSLIVSGLTCRRNIW